MWSTSTITSRATRPLPNVTTRAASSSRVSTTKPGASRVCTAPTSAIASHTAPGFASTTISRCIDAMAVSLLG